MVLVPTPRARVYSQTATGLTDMTVSNGVLKLLGCSVIDISSQLGLNGASNSATITLVQDLANGDAFTEPVVPSVLAISLPAGGIGASIFPADNTELEPNGFNPTNTPFYICGIVTNIENTIISSSGRQLSVTITDAREVLRGVQVILGGVALSQEIGGSGPRYVNVDNVIDAYGYWSYGMESENTTKGMPWHKIQTALEAIQCAVYGINFEFYFTGDAFNDVPVWYKVGGDIVDFISLVQGVVNDAGSDLEIISRKVASDAITVELRSIKRMQADILTATELTDFIDARADIITYASQGKEFKNEPTSKIILGGRVNKNYVAYPSTYDPDMHLSTPTTTWIDREGNDVTPPLVEDIDQFPVDIKERLLTGIGIDAGAIFPFWGFAPQSQTPLLDPLITLDHFAFDKYYTDTAEAVARIPLLKIVNANYTVREVVHEDVFLEDDGTSSVRPFAILEEYIISDTPTAGYVRGMPLNTEILRAALVSYEAYSTMVGIYYPDVAESLGMALFDFDAMNTWASQDASGNREGFLEAGSSFLTYFWPDVRPNADPASMTTQDIIDELTRRSESALITATTAITTEEEHAKWLTALHTSNSYYQDLLRQLNLSIYEEVHNYAKQHLGQQFLVCLPRSLIMERIFNGQSVPTNIEKPEIEYVFDSSGFWEELPPELDGKNNNNGVEFDQEIQIREHFQEDDGRFRPMAFIDWAPSGNAGFSANGLNHAMFQDLPVNSYRPNQLAAGNPTYVAVDCQVHQLEKRPDLAIVTLNQPLVYDPTDAELGKNIYGFSKELASDRDLDIREVGFMKFMVYHYRKNATVRSIFGNDIGIFSKVIRHWSKKIRSLLIKWEDLSYDMDVVIDLRQINIPLTSTWITYGPWYYTVASARGQVEVEVDDDLVPWNYPVASGQEWYENLDAAGFERLARSLNDAEYIHTAQITVAGFPEYGLGSPTGFNSNLNGISVTFGAGGVTTTYGFSTHIGKPGTFRKSEFDKLEVVPDPLRKALPDTQNINLFAGTDRYMDLYGTNKFTR